MPDYTYHDVVEANHEAVDGNTGKPCGVMVKAVRIVPTMSLDLAGLQMHVDGEWVDPHELATTFDIFKPGMKLRLPVRS